MTELFDKHESEVEHLPWPAESTDLNIFEPLWVILEQGRKRFPPDLSSFLQRNGSQSLWPLSMACIYHSQD